jgi:PTS system mannose-specific IIA component
MVKKLIVSHGQFAAHLVHAARRIHDEALGDISVLCLDWDITLDMAQEQVGAFLRELGTEDGLLILTDVFGATPSNACRPFVETGRVEIVTGVNLPMVIRLGSLRDQPQSVSDLAEWIRKKALTSIVHIQEPTPRAARSCFSDAEPADG